MNSQAPRPDEMRIQCWRRHLWLLAGAAWLAVVGVSPAQSLDGWGSDGGPGSPIYANSNTVGVTTGLWSLQTTNPQGSFWGPSTPNLVTNDFNALKNATKISFDLTLNNNQLNGGSPFSGFAQANELAVQLYSNPGGTAPLGINSFIQRNFATGNGTDTSGQNATWSGVDGVRTITFDLTTFTYTNQNNASDPENGDSLFQILTNHPDLQDAKIDFVEQLGGGSAPGNFFYDNVRLLDGTGNTLAVLGDFEGVPEPSTLALVGLAVPAIIAAARRRRAKRD
jgi:hypothetical protein